MRNVRLVDNVKNINTRSYDNISEDPCASYLEKSASNPKVTSVRCCQKNKQRGNQCDMKIIRILIMEMNVYLCVYDDK